MPRTPTSTYRLQITEDFDLVAAARILGYLHEPATVSRLWDLVRNARKETHQAAPINYDWFILALDLLFMVGAVDLDRGLVRKASAP